MLRTPQAPYGQREGGPIIAHDLTRTQHAAAARPWSAASARTTAVQYTRSRPRLLDQQLAAVVDTNAFNPDGRRPSLLIALGCIPTVPRPEPLLAKLDPSRSVHVQQTDGGTARGSQAEDLPGLGKEVLRPIVLARIE
jgi:hypothetical protein